MNTGVVTFTDRGRTIARRYIFNGAIYLYEDDRDECINKATALDALRKVEKGLCSGMTSKTGSIHFEFTPHPLSDNPAKTLADCGFKAVVQE